MNAVGTKQLEEEDRIIIPRAQRGSGTLIDFIGASILPVYTAFKFDEHDKITDAWCDVGEVIPAGESTGVSAVDTYLTNLADYRSEREEHEVVYAQAA